MGMQFTNNSGCSNMAIFSLVSSAIGTILDRVLPNKVERDKAKAELAILEAKGELEVILKQLEINSNEAKHSSVFVAGARPFILWVCGSAFAYHFLIYPIMISIAAFNGMDVSNLPQFDMSQMLPVLGGLLGLGGFRTYEKMKGVARSSLKDG